MPGPIQSSINQAIGTTLGAIAAGKHVNEQEKANKNIKTNITAEGEAKLEELASKEKSYQKTIDLNLKNIPSPSQFISQMNDASKSDQKKRVALDNASRAVESIRSQQEIYREMLKNLI